MYSTSQQLINRYDTENQTFAFYFLLPSSFATNTKDKTVTIVMKNSMRTMEAGKCSSMIFEAATGILHNNNSLFLFVKIRHQVQ